MRVPYSWLREYLPDAPGDVPAAAEQLTLSGTKVEALHVFGVPSADNGGSEGYRVGRVVEFEQHPDADRLRLCRVDVGEGAPRQIVCGASNFQKGDAVAVVLPGSTLPGGHRIGTAKLRGVESHGMMLSERELELGTDHSGIMILPAEWPVGARLGEFLPLGDDVLELEITPNRPDCLGVYGVARELGAVTGAQLADALAGDAEATAAGSVEDHVRVELQAPELCPRYMARAFVDVEVGPSPHWLRARLAAAGMRAINNVVDVTNYVMLATGQPLHAFDADQLEEGRILVRRAHDGEKVTTLDGVERTLDASMLSIADARRTAVIAGVMGAADVEVSERTTRLVLEAASFEPQAIMRASLELGLRSESSSRFEKGLDPYLPEVALRLASRLLVELSGAKMVPGTVDEVAGGKLAPLPTFTLRAKYPSSVLGLQVDAHEIERILRSLGYQLDAAAPGGWQVTVPHWRMRDTLRPIDLVEEVGRIHGLDQLPATMPARRSLVGMLSREQRLQRMLEDAAARLGFHETATYSLVPEGYNEQFGQQFADVVRLANPMTVDHALLRGSLVGSHLEVLRHNRAAGAADGALFEVARVFSAIEPGATDEHGQPAFARERRVLALCAAGELYGGRFDAAGIPADLPAVAGVLQSLLAAAGLDALLQPFDADPPAWLHPGQAAVVQDSHGRVFGWAGSLHPSLAKAHDVRGEVVVAEVDLGAVESALGGIVEYEPISTFPPSRQDIAVVLPATVLAGQVVAAAEAAGGDLLEQVEVFDRYEGEQVEEGHYSLALRLTFRAPDRTLTDDEADQVRTRVAAALTDQFGARLREQ